MSFEGWTIHVIGYQPVDDRLQNRLARICAELDRLPDSAFQVDEAARVVTVDYSQVRDLPAFQRAIGVIRATDKMIVAPPGEAVASTPDEILLVIDAGSAFGSGLHETTCLCLRALEKYAKPGGTAIDFGTGSGILAIAAAKLGMTWVTAIEADADSATTAAGNVQHNQLQERIRVLHASCLLPENPKVDVITANLTAGMLIEHLHSMVSLLRPGGKLIASGMTEHNAATVEDSFGRAGCPVIDRLTEGDWVALVCTRGKNPSSERKREA